MINLMRPVDPNNPIVFLDIQIGLENGKKLFRFSYAIKYNHNQ